MKRLTEWLCIVLVWGVMPALSVTAVCNEAAHPERWGDWRENPWIWGPALAAIFIGSAAFVLYLEATDGKWLIDRMWKPARHRGL